MTHSQLGGLSALWVLALGLGYLPAESPIIPSDLPTPSIDYSRKPIVPSNVLAVPAVTPPAPPPSHLPLFRIQPGFLNDVTWLDDDVIYGNPNTKPPATDPEPDFFSLSAGNDNPLFDFRTKGDPGGVGYSRVNTQLQIFDTSKTSVSLGLQGVTPTGMAANGLADNRGMTVVTPGFSVFHELDEGLGLQAFVSKNMPLLNSTATTAVAPAVQSNLQYGMAIHSAVTTDPKDPLSNLFLSVGALGQLAPDGDGGKSFNWDVMPGMHVRLGDKWWLSGGVLVPVGPNTLGNSGHWRVTCQWQF